MKFKKVNNHIVKCLISEEEIVEMGFELEDICKNQDRASEFMKEIITKGNEEGYEISENVTAVQATLLPDHRVVLCFTDGETDGMVDKTIENLLRAFGLVNSIGKDKLEDISRLNGQEKKEAFDECLEEVASAKELSEAQKTGRKDDKEETAEHVIEPQKYILEFNNLDSIEEFCKVAPAVPSTLYKKEGIYYMLSDLTEAQSINRSTFLLQAGEFTSSLKREHLESGYLEEHCDVLIQENPMEVLREL